MTTAWIEVALVPQSEIALSQTRPAGVEISTTTTEVQIQAYPAPQIEVAIGVPGPPGPPGEVVISTDPNNRAATGSDGGIYVSDDLNPDPLAYYIIARG